MSRAIAHDGVVYRRDGSKFRWICYRDRAGKRQRESTFTRDWHEAQEMLRRRLEARDGNVLPMVRKGEGLSFGEWADLFLEDYSKPPVRQPGTHEANLRCVQHLWSRSRPVASRHGAQRKSLPWKLYATNERRRMNGK